MVDLLREVLEELPFPPIAQDMAVQAGHPAEPALQALMRAAREVLGDPGAAWDAREIQAIAAAPYDQELRTAVELRLESRWAAAETVVRQLRGNADVAADDDDAAALHLISVGLGLALLAPVAPRWSEPQAWTGLTARLLETLHSDGPTVQEPSDTRWRIRITTTAEAAATVRVLHVLSVLRVRVVSLFTARLPGDRQLVDAFLSSPVDVDRDTIVHGLASVGSDVIVTRGREEDAADIATRVLALSVALVEDPARAPEAAAELVLADSWEIIDAASGEDSTARVLRLQWSPERHVLLRRVVAPFTQTERNRASALLDLIGAVSEVRGDSDGYGWREDLANGQSISVRLSRPADTVGVESLHDRCSEASRYQRYFTPMNSWREDNLRHISGGHRGATLVVTDDRERIIALGNLFPVGPQDTQSAEIAVLVDDAWHGLGVGALLTEHLIDVARRMEFDRLVAYVLADNRGMRSLLASSSLTWRATPDHDMGTTVVCLVADLT